MLVIKSIATYARIHWPEEYKEYLAAKVWSYSAHNNRKRVRQILKANIINGDKEYKFKDWSIDYENYCKNYYWQGVHDCAETY